MAITKIWKVKGSASAVIRYADDPEKVIGTIYASDLNDVIRYADDDSKTEQHV